MSPLDAYRSTLPSLVPRDRAGQRRASGRQLRHSLAGIFCGVDTDMSRCITPPFTTTLYHITCRENRSGRESRDWGKIVHHMRPGKYRTTAGSPPRAIGKGKGIIVIKTHRVSIVLSQACCWREKDIWVTVARGCMDSHVDLAWYEICLLLWGKACNRADWRIGLTPEG